MKAFCLLNHPLTEKQENELLNKYNCDKIIYPSKELAAAWSQIPAVPENDRSIIKAVTDWLLSAEEKVRSQKELKVSRGMEKLFTDSMFLNTFVLDLMNIIN